MRAKQDGAWSGALTEQLVQLEEKVAGAEFSSGNGAPDTKAQSQHCGLEGSHRSSPASNEGGVIFGRLIEPLRISASSSAKPGGGSSLGPCRLQRDLAGIAPSAVP